MLTCGWRSISKPGHMFRRTRVCLTQVAFDEIGQVPSRLAKAFETLEMTSLAQRCVRESWDPNFLHRLNYRTMSEITQSQPETEAESFSRFVYEFHNSNNSSQETMSRTFSTRAKCGAKKKVEP